MSKINLQTLGFSAKFAEEAASFGCFPVGRVSAQYKDLYRVITETGEVLAEVSGKLRFNAAALSDFPAVGDFLFCLTAQILLKEERSSIMYCAAKARLSAKLPVQVTLSR